MAALAAAVDHVHAAALNELLREREQLLLDRQRLALQAENLRREVAQLRGAAAWALRDLQMGEIETAEERLAQVFEGSDA